MFILFTYSFLWKCCFPLSTRNVLVYLWSIQGKIYWLLVFFISVNMLDWTATANQLKLWFRLCLMCSTSTIWLQYDVYYDMTHLVFDRLTVLHKLLVIKFTIQRKAKVICLFSTSFNKETLQITKWKENSAKRHLLISNSKNKTKWSKIRNASIKWNDFCWE